ncbi:MAG TPA: hypothetical protein VK427_02505 [Kofleriaceae bacterium]|nr:hypothetical protein [Kofleriaceae bacterium]
MDGDIAYNPDVTNDEAVKWLEQQGLRIRQFDASPQINAGYGDGTVAGGIRLLGRVMAQISPDEGNGWQLWEHGRTIQRFAEFDQAVYALRDYLIAKDTRPDPMCGGTPT